MANDDPHAQMIRKAPDGFDPRKVRCRHPARKPAPACARRAGARARRGVRRAAARAARPAAAGRTRRPSARRRSGDRSCRRGASTGSSSATSRARARGRRGRAAGGREALDRVRLPHPGREDRAGNARRRHLDERRADAEAVADLHLARPEARQGQVLAERPRLGCRAEALHPPGVVLAAVEVERLVEPSWAFSSTTASPPSPRGPAKPRPTGALRIPVEIVRPPIVIGSARPALTETTFTGAQARSGAWRSCAPPALGRVVRGEAGATDRLLRQPRRRLHRLEREVVGDVAPISSRICSTER